MERHPFERRLTPCAEFPNDNADLHHGAIWACVELGLEPACELPPPRPLAPAFEGEPGELTHLSQRSVPASEASGESLTPDGGSDDLDADRLADDADPIEIVDELSFDDALEDLPSGSEAAQLESERPSADPFAQLLSALGDVARALGAGDAGTACLDALFGETRLEGIAVGERVVEALIAGGVIARGARGFTRSASFAAKVIAWQGILRGESEDFSLPNGGTLEPLDEWAADVLSRVAGSPARVDGIRRDLRRRGIAAFGLVAEAA